MDRERRVIDLICRNMPRSDAQLNRLFESDSEILEFRCGKLLFNIDEFSEEDLIKDNEPFTLGWNLASGSISDILATGGKPLYYAHSLVAGKAWSDEFISRFSDGVASCIKEAGAVFIGGDFGQSQGWRYTVTVIGELEGRPLLRSGARERDSVYITGEIGAGNIDAGLKLFSKEKILGPLLSPVINRFKLRVKESRLISEYSGCCIDTSDGVFNALNAVSEMSNTGYEINFIPYVKSGLVIAKMLSLPKLLMFLGECGEYELLFTIGKEHETDFLNEAQKRGLVFYKIGDITDKSMRILNQNNQITDMSSLDIRARDYNDAREYLKALNAWLTVNQKQ